MKSKVLAGLALAGVIGIAGAASANVTAAIKIDDMPRFANRPQAQQIHPKLAKNSRPPMPPEFNGKQPPMSRDNRMPPPPGAHSPDKRPPEMNGKRPPMPPRSGDRKPPEFKGQKPQMPKGR